MRGRAEADGLARVNPPPPAFVCPLFSFLTCARARYTMRERARAGGWARAGALRAGAGTGARVGVGARIDSAILENFSNAETGIHFTHLHLPVVG